MVRERKRAFQRGLGRRDPSGDGRWVRVDVGVREVAARRVVSLEGFAWVEPHGAALGVLEASEGPKRHRERLDACERFPRHRGCGVEVATGRVVAVVVVQEERVEKVDVGHPAGVGLVVEGPDLLDGSPLRGRRADDHGAGVSQVALRPFLLRIRARGVPGLFGHGAPRGET